MESQNNHPGERDTSQGGNGGKPDNSGDTARITNKQLNYIVNLGRNIGWNSTDLDRESTKIRHENGVPQPQVKYGKLLAETNSQKSLKK